MKQKTTPKKTSVKTTKKHLTKPSLPKAESTTTFTNVIKELHDWVNKNSFIGFDYSRWYCGVTNNPQVRKSAHRNRIKNEPFFFLAKSAHSKRIALAIETYFHGLGMLDKDIKGNVKENSWYVYVFKQYPTFFDS